MVPSVTSRHFGGTRRPPREAGGGPSRGYTLDEGCVCPNVLPGLHTASARGRRVNAVPDTATTGFDRRRLAVYTLDLGCPRRGTGHQGGSYTLDWGCVTCVRRCVRHVRRRTNRPKPSFGRFHSRPRVGDWRTRRIRLRFPVRDTSRPLTVPPRSVTPPVGHTSGPSLARSPSQFFAPSVGHPSRSSLL